MTPQETTAACILFAFNKHLKHVRKYTQLPYFIHLAEVAVKSAQLARSLGLASEQTETIIRASYLHDTLEDTDATDSEVLAVGGAEVYAVVKAMTDPPPEFGNRKARKAAKCAQLAASSVLAQVVAAADMLNNAHSIAEHDPSFWNVFRREKEDITASLCLLPGWMTDSLRWELEDIDRRCSEHRLQLAPLRNN